MNKTKLNYTEKKLSMKIEPFEMFKRLYAHFDTCFLLESLGNQGVHARYAYIGVDPVQHIVGKEKSLIIDGKEIPSDNPYTFLQKQLPHLNEIPKEGFAGGLAGYFTYEATQYFEDAFVGHLDNNFPLCEFGLFLDGFRFDRLGEDNVYFSLDKDRFSLFEQYVSKPYQSQPFSYKKVGSFISQKQHTKIIEEAHKRILAGDIFQVVLSAKSFYEVGGDILTLYEALRTINPSPNMFFFKFGDRVVLGASPELLIRVDERKLTHFGTLAGTVKRGKSLEEDEKLAEELRSDEKEKAEHIMLVDLARNDVGKICKFGSVRVEKILAVKKFSHVQHLSSEIYGELCDDMDSFSALAACFPAGTLSGAPKVEAMKIIAELEGEARGPYGGVSGYFSTNGNCMFCINIRCLSIVGDKAVAQVGSGIVYDSNAEKEYQEILNKGKGMEVALKMAMSNFKLI